MTICSDKNVFCSLDMQPTREKLFMRNLATSDVTGTDHVILKMTSEKEMKLTNVLYVSDIRKNLISGTLLCNHEFKIVF